MGGFAFGMLANNPFFGCCYGFGGGYSNIDIVDFGTFANPFPQIAGGDYIEKPQIFTTFANPFPCFDFSGITQSIWDMATNPDSDYNKRLKEYYENLEKQNNSNNSNTQIYNPMQFQQFYMPQTTFNPYFTGLSRTTESKEKDSDKPAEQIELNYDAKKLKEKWSKKKNLSDTFYEKVIDISKKIKCDPNDLMAVMWYESAHTFNPAEPNSIGAVGLIQFMPDTARTLGTTTEELKNMSAEKQLDYVEKYLVANKKDAGYDDNKQLDAGTLYSLVFLPGRSKRNVLTSKGEKYYSQNKSLDYNKDGKITKLDLSSVVKDNMA